MLAQYDRVNVCKDYIYTFIVLKRTVFEQRGCSEFLFSTQC